MFQFMKDLTIEILTASLTYANVIVCVFTLPLMLFTLIVLFHGKRTFENAFFTFYKIGLTTDIVAILAGILFGIAPSLGWFVEQYTATEVPLRLFYFFNWFTRVMQGCTNTYICLNRATATLVPLMHAKESSLKTKYSSKDKKARSLLWIAVVVISLELVYCVYFFFAFVDNPTEHRDLRIFMTKYFLVTEAYAVLPTYILLVFSGSLLKTLLLVCALLALALARADREDRESHRANKHAAQRRVTDNGENNNKREDDWRCVTNVNCRHKGGWCVPNFTANLKEEVEERRRLRDSDESEDRE
ncbi:hypothetical protein PRIPAC_78408 [Pristionchus pacificus]|uniref:Serpentine receptor class gamma n=1 Tax=Pristionchus pacificus TaxID=54126 RepID=A0A2A6C372_PRIPA|nr:hypothetical protein PRIPAC_78408 [Pristionchus pacificus]|eukprot:PDM72682.1 G protein-coupled receptor [Pristionchus pacificus]